MTTAMTTREEGAALRQLRADYRGIRLGDIPGAARAEERDARLRAIALAGQDGADEPSYEIILAAGCHGEPTPPTVGWVWTRAAAQALSERVTHMPGGSSHRRLAIA